MPVENLRGSLLMVLAMAGFAIEDMLLGALVFGERPGPLMLAGATLVVGAGLYTIWRETVTRHRALQVETAGRETGTW